MDDFDESKKIHYDGQGLGCAWQKFLDDVHACCTPMQPDSTGVGQVSSPTPATRQGCYDRDGHRCASCGRTFPLQFQHRQAVGMGGSKTRPTFAEGLTACDVCNAAFEADLQADALRFGWKVARWVLSAGLVPVWYRVEKHWFRLTAVGTRVPITHVEAMRMMHDVYGDQYRPDVGLGS